VDQWKQHLNQYLVSLVELFEADRAKLRFERSTIAASDIAEQFFCEKKVEMQYLHGEIESEAKLVGTQAHEKLLEDSVRVEREEMWQSIYGKDPVLALETLFFAQIKDVIVAGKPDSILFRDGYPLVIFEYKFSKSQAAYKTHHVQAGTYGLLLENVGFNTRFLHYAIVVADPSARFDKQLKKKVAAAIGKNGLRDSEIEIEKAKIYLHKFDREAAEEDLDWAVKFWKKEREALPTENGNKCRSCDYFKDCRS
jgi:CRISPR/Cas system-associated exonuclease Cas4 (RecB family)